MAEPTSAAGQADTGTERLDGGSYDVIRRRLLEQASELRAKADALNERRKKVFGSSELKLVATERVRTEHNCVPRDIVSIAGHLLFGFHVYLGLKSETRVQDVLSLHRFQTTDSGFDLSQLGLDAAGGFLTSPEFAKDFHDAFRYGRDAHLVQLRRTDQRLLVMIRVGEGRDEVRVFRFSISASGTVHYIDGRGEEDAVLPRAHDFTWTQATREDQVPGPHPHVSILDEVFVETVGGDLTVKVENNTADGWGIYREPVEEANQTLDDADIAYAKLGVLILLRVRPFREKQYRYLLFNTRTQTVARVDAIEQACLQLPEDHGIIFPGGYHLRTGEMRRFEGDTTNMQFERMLRSPNGEDVLYVFHRPDIGLYSLLPYNLVRKEVQTPIACHGYSLFDDGRMIIFRAASDEPTRVHPVQIWQTPFMSAEYAASAPTDGSYLAKVGNADLVRGISDAYTVCQLATSDQPSRQTYEELIASCTRFADAYYWIGHQEAGDLGTSVTALRQTSELIIDEFEKLAAIRKRAREAIANAGEVQQTLLKKARPEDLRDLEAFMQALTALRKQRGHLISLRELREVDLKVLEALETEVARHFETVSQACVSFLINQDAFAPLKQKLASLLGELEAATKAVELVALAEQIDAARAGLTLLSEVVNGLSIGDATARTAILESIGEVFGQLNRVRATYQSRQKELSSHEARGEFAAQFALLAQSVTSALGACDTPERCDEELSRMLVLLEDLEGRFGEFGEFVAELAVKREEVTEAFGARRQSLVDERQRRAHNLWLAAERILTGVTRRARAMAGADELHSYFSSDPMIQKLGSIAEQLESLGDSVKAEEVRSKLKSARQDALRALRDRSDLYEEGERVLRLGRHKFSVNAQPLELTMLPRDGQMHLHLTGTGFFEPIDDAVLNDNRDLWDQSFVSESPEVYRGEYLAATLLRQAEEGTGGWSVAKLQEAALSDSLRELVRQAAAERYDEGYDRGVHDEDASRILERLLAMRASAGLLRFGPTPRALACLYYAHLAHDERTLLQRRARAAGLIHSKLNDARAQMQLAGELEPAIDALAQTMRLEPAAAHVRAASRYLVEELATEPARFATSNDALALRDALLAHLDEQGARRAFDDDLRALESRPADRLQLVLSYLRAFLSQRPELKQEHVMLEAAVVAVTERRLEREPVAAVTTVQVQGLLGQHPRIQDRTLTVRLDEFLDRLDAFMHERVPRFRKLREARTRVLEREAQRLRLDEYKPRVLTSFVRNRLIDEVYLPLIGTNLAKQLGALGDSKRTDLMGLLLLISPPGYGKTTLMEYIASRLGLVFVKVNGPSLGNAVVSLDPSEAPNATARQEVDKINFALEAGNNVMLYLDDIQHTNPELLQKFISLCDAQRRIEGVWAGRTRTYDLRGKRFCVVMAGNPYTESGAKFQIPDMLANRADTYNLGEVLEGKDDLFALSYLENCLTSNPTLAPLAARDPADIYKLLRMAEGEEVPVTDLAYGYSNAEVAEIVAVLRLLGKARSTLLRVNRHYILSASQEDSFRTEPAFKLQGSYRNMNKIAEKVVAAMNDEELERLVDDHYQGEAQTLTKGAEQNLLKLAELRGRMTDEQRARWQAIQQEFVRVRRMGGKQDDPAVRISAALSGLDEQLAGIREGIVAASKQKKSSTFDTQALQLTSAFERLGEQLQALGRPKVELELRQEPPPGVGELLAQQTSLIEKTLVPLVRSAMRGPHDSRDEVLEARIAELTAAVRALDARLGTSLELAAPRFEVDLRDGAPHSFLTAQGDGGQVAGMFVSTRAAAPAVGSSVILNVVFPWGGECDIRGTVAWHRAPGASSSEPAGFAVRWTSLDPKARQAVEAYLRHGAAEPRV